MTKIRLNADIHWYASPSMYSARRIKGCDAAVNNPEYIGTTWSLRDATYTILAYGHRGEIESAWKQESTDAMTNDPSQRLDVILRNIAIRILYVNG